MHGLHASPFHGFSVEFSEHRKYTPGDDPHDIDWLVYAKTDKYYVKKFEAETNITGYLAMDLSESMAYTYRQELTKFDYAICLAAALCYLMIHQNDPVGVVTFAEQITQLSGAQDASGSRSATSCRCWPSCGRPGKTDVGRSLVQLAAMLKHASLVMVFSDLLAEPEPIISALRQLRHGGHDVILFHILDEAEVAFPFSRAGGIGRAGDERAAGSRCRQLSPRLPAGDRASSARRIAANVFRAASITCRWIRACRSIGR